MRCAYHPDYFVPLPPSHPFPMAKYPLLYARLRSAGLVRDADLIEPAEAALDDLRLVHTGSYLEQLASGTLDAAAVRRIGVPWSAALWRRSRLAAQGTLEAARAALHDGLAANLAGGTHHAFPGHGERNYPTRKMRSTLDVGLADGLGDDDYLALLEQHLDAIFAGFTPDLVFYLAGVDPVQGDRYGRLGLSDAGLRRRERCVLEACRSRDRPAVITIAGGYARTPERTAELHSIVFEEAVALRARAADHWNPSDRGVPEP